jgi:hypothetical protein
MTIPVQFFEQISCLYRAELMNPWWVWYEEEPCPKRALALLVGQYAYERQGRAPDYPHAAYFAVQASQASGPAGIWRAFLRELDGVKPNAQRNPLFHSPAGCTCAWCTFADAAGELADIVEFARSALADGRVRQAFERLDRVRGIGPKIASFFLRDAATWFGTVPARERELLQPVDMWVRRGVTRLAGDVAAGTDSQVARWICMNCAAPEAFNQGLWYFASRIAASDVKLRRALGDEAYARDLVERYVGQRHQAVTAWQGVSRERGPCR